MVFRNQWGALHLETTAIERRLEFTVYKRHCIDFEDNSFSGHVIRPAHTRLSRCLLQISRRSGGHKVGVTWSCFAKHLFVPSVNLLCVSYFHTRRSKYKIAVYKIEHPGHEVQRWLLKVRRLENWLGSLNVHEAFVQSQKKSGSKAIVSVLAFFSTNFKTAVAVIADHAASKLKAKFDCIAEIVGYKNSSSAWLETCGQHGSSILMYNVYNLLF